jgi:hypothetical protein
MRLCERCPHIQLFQPIGGVAASGVSANAMPPAGTMTKIGATQGRRMEASSAADTTWLDQA